MTYMNIAEGFSYVDDEYLCLVEQVKKQRRTWRVALKRVAMFFLALLVGASVWLAVDEGARAAFQRWWREITKTEAVYQFSGNAEGVLPRYEMTWMPEGFSIVEEDTIDEDEIRFTYYLSENDDLSFQYSWMFDGTTTFISNPNGVPDTEECKISGMQAWFYPAGEDSIMNSLIWTDEERSIVFSIDSSLDKDTMLRIAESVAVTDAVK